MTRGGLRSDAIRVHKVLLNILAFMTSQLGQIQFEEEKKTDTTGAGFIHP